MHVNTPSLAKQKSESSSQPLWARRDAERTKQRVLIVDDHPVTRCGLRELVAQMMNTEVCADTGCVTLACDVARRIKPQVAIVGIELQDMDGLQFTRQIKEVSPATSVLVVSLHDEVLYADTCIQAGASGFIMKSEAAATIRLALEQLLSGNTYLSGRMQDRMLQMLASRRRSDGEFGVNSLSEREDEVIQLMGEGYNPVEIAERLNVSRKTVDAYRDHLRRKLCLPNSNDLTRYAIQRYHSTHAIRQWHGIPDTAELVEVR